MYAIQATVMTVVDGWTRTQQIPTFYLDENVQGIVDERHAKLIAEDILNPLKNNDLAILISATYVGSVGG